MRSILLLVFFEESALFFFWRGKVESKKSVPPLPSIYKRERGFWSSLLSNNGFIRHHYCSSAAASLCHLSCCYFSEMSRFTSDTELINDDIIVVISFPDIMLVEAVIHSTLVICSISSNDLSPG